VNQYDNLPQELRENGRFNCWRYEVKKGGGKPDKVPYNVLTGGKGQSNNPATFTDYRTALSAVKNYDGLGVGVFGDLEFIDIDHCVKDRVIVTAEARDIVETMDSYTEISPSGTGLRIIGKAPGFRFDASRYYIQNKRRGLEIYISGVTKKFLTVTGNTIRAKGLEERGAQLRIVLNKYMIRPSPRKPANVEARSYLTDDAVLAKAMAAKNGEAFRRLWEGDTSGYASHSEADMALCSMLAFWCGWDTEQMDRLFRRSGLYRDKWDRPQSGSTYGALTLAKAATDAHEIYTPGGKREAAAVDFSGGITLEDIRPESNPRYEWNDIGTGNLFADMYKDELRYVPERKSWFFYDGSIWKQDTGSLHAMERCKRLFEQWMMYALGITDERRRTDYIKFITKWSSRGCRETILKDAQGVYPVSMTEFDKDPMVFNCANVTLFLTKDGVDAMPHNSADFLTKISDVVYNPSARSDRWLRFTFEIMSNNGETCRFVQKSFGYGFTGATHLECLFVLYGATTRNGKGTICESVLRVAGGYGCTVRPETISLKTGSNSQAPTEDVARLSGIHFANISEPGKGLVLNAALMKSMTGNDTLNARFLHENSFDFRPQFKIFINTNYLPVVADTTLFSSGRLIIIPFERHFDENEQDKTLKQEFAKPEVQSAILNWLIEGWLMLQSEGLEPPESVKAATESYRHESDKIGMFVEDCLISEPNSEIRTADAYARYQEWCRDNGCFAENARNFRQSLQSAVRVERKRPRNGGEKTTLIIGYKLTSGFLAL